MVPSLIGPHQTSFSKQWTGRVSTAATHLSWAAHQSPRFATPQRQGCTRLPCLPITYIGPDRSHLTRGQFFHLWQEKEQLSDSQILAVTRGSTAWRKPHVILSSNSTWPIRGSRVLRRYMRKKCSFLPIPPLSVSHAQPRANLNKLRARQSK